MEINIHEIESLLQMATADFCDYGVSELERERYLSKWRSRIGYCNKHLMIYKSPLTYNE